MTQTKIRTLDDALRWRRALKGKLVFTNGVFDLLHVGHVHLLESARALGSALAVGVNDDDSARRLGKGVDRPVNPLDHRLRLVAALACVDCVMSFREDTPESLIRTLEPDVLVKGGDYRGKDVPGAEFVTQQGGEVVLIDLMGEISTTRLMERIRGPET